MTWVAEPLKKFLQNIEVTRTACESDAETTILCLRDLGRCFVVPIAETDCSISRDILERGHLIVLRQRPMFWRNQNFPAWVGASFNRRYKCYLKCHEDLLVCSTSGDDRDGQFQRAWETLVDGEPGGPDRLEASSVVSQIAEVVSRGDRHEAHLRFGGVVQ